MSSLTSSLSNMSMPKFSLKSTMELAKYPIPAWIVLILVIIFIVTYVYKPSSKENFQQPGCGKAGAKESDYSLKCCSGKSVLGFCLPPNPFKK